MCSIGVSVPSEQLTDRNPVLFILASERKSLQERLSSKELEFCCLFGFGRFLGVFCFLVFFCIVSAVSLLSHPPK